LILFPWRTGYHLKEASNSNWERVLQEQKQVFAGAYATELHIFGITK